MNDEINRLVRAKGHWDRRIRELGGAIFDAADQNDVEEDDGDALFIGGGNIYKYPWLFHSYPSRYYGAAKNLPEVKALLKKDPEDVRNRQ